MYGIINHDFWQVRKKAGALFHDGVTNCSNIRPGILPKLGGIQRHLLLCGLWWILQLCGSLCVRFVTNFNNKLTLIPNCTTSMQISDLSNKHNTPLTCVLVGVCRIQDSAWGSAPWGSSWDLVWAKCSCQQWPTSSVTGGGSWCPWQSLDRCTSPSGGKLMNWHSTQSSWGPWTWSNCTT